MSDSQVLAADASGNAPHDQNDSAVRKRFAVDGREPREVSFPTTVEEVAACVQHAAEQGSALIPVGNGTLLHLGGLPRQYDLALSVSHLNRIVDYQPTDMTVTVEAGMTLAELQKVLGENGQWLPIDAPVPEQTTIGSLIATNVSGPSRLSQGTIRDFLLGIKVVRADGTIIKGGGRVVKNVAGYDVPKLFCGSLGTLGVIVEAVFKVRPRFAVQELLALPFSSVTPAMNLVIQVLGTELQPVFLELTNFDPLARPDEHFAKHWLFAGFAGIAEEVAYQVSRFREIHGERSKNLQDLPAATQSVLFEKLRDFPVARATLSCKIGVLPTRVAQLWQAIEEEAALHTLSVNLLAHAGNGIVYCHVSPADERIDKILSLVDWLRILAKKLDGYVVVEMIAPELKTRLDVWGHVGNAFPLMRRLKEALDPTGILSPGRFVGGI